MTKLLPCPFCGNAPQTKTWHQKGHEAMRIWCDEHSVQIMVQSTKDTAIEAWNSRYSERESSKECCIPELGEPSFVLLGRDPQAPDLVEKWANDRERLDPRSLKPEAARCIANGMRRYRKDNPTKGLQLSKIEDRGSDA